MTALGPHPVSTIVLLSVVACWAAFGLAFAFRPKAPRSEETKRDSRSFLGIGLQMVSSILLWIFVRMPPRPIFRMPLAGEIIVGGITVLIAVASVCLVVAARRALGRQWAYAARLVRGHELVTTGAYSLVRNPIYTGMLGMWVATGLALSYWLTFLLALAIFLLGTTIRVRTEEKLLRQAFGAQFDAYSARVPSLLPGIY